MKSFYLVASRIRNPVDEKCPLPSEIRSDCRENLDGIIKTQ